MKTRSDIIRQAQCEIDAAIAKRTRAVKLLSEAEEEIIMARMKLEDAKRGKQQIQE